MKKSINAKQYRTLQRLIRQVEAQIVINEAQFTEMALNAFHNHLNSTPMTDRIALCRSYLKEVYETQEVAHV